jgi:GxxExxY protein
MPLKENEIGSILVDCAVALHRGLGPGLLESVYEVTLCRALEKRGLQVRRQVPVPIEYDGEKFDEAFRADLIIEGKVIVELKSVEKVSPAHKKQLLTYLRLTGLKLGYLLNFGEVLMKDGISRTINGTLDPLPSSSSSVSPCLRERSCSPSA